MTLNRLDVPKSIRRIIVLHRDDAGFVATTELHGRRRRKKKQSKGLKPFEKAMRRMAKAQRRGAAVYLGRHQRSNRRKKNGWARKFPKNMMKAQRKAAKVLFR